MRLDRFLSNNGYGGSRKSAKKIIKDGRVTVNGEVTRINDAEISGSDEIKIDGTLIPNVPYVTLILNKPEDYISSTIDETYPSILHLIPVNYQKRVRIVGRLDADTTGLILLTDNGILNSRLTNPKYRVEKTYHVTVNHILKPILAEEFAKGGDIGRGEITAPARLEVYDEYNCDITVTEGKYHEIKRLFGKFGYDVISLKRISFGPLRLGDLELGKCRMITDEEYDLLLQSVHMKKEDQL